MATHIITRPLNQDDVRELHGGETSVAAQAQAVPDFYAALWRRELARIEREAPAGHTAVITSVSLGSNGAWRSTETFKLDRWVVEMEYVPTTESPA